MSDALKFDTARLSPDKEHKLRAWRIHWRSGVPLALRDCVLLSTDASFAKFRHPDGTLTLIAIHAIKLIESLPAEHQVSSSLEVRP